MQLTQRTILITGGTSGIGRALAERLAGRGNTVIVTGRDPGRLADLARARPAIHAIASDVADPAAVSALRDHVLGQWPALDVLVNNAGVMRNLDFARAGTGGLDDVTREIGTNLDGPLRMVDAFLPHLRARAAAHEGAGDGALVVNVTSGLAFVPYPLAPVYSATKAALHAFTAVLRLQLAGTGVRVVELAPPPVETPLFRGEFAEATRGQTAMTPAALAERAVAGIEAGRLEIRPGLSNVLKVMSRVAPQLMLGQLARMSRPPRPAPAAHPTSRPLP